jgi:hypothetical protein
MDEEDGLGEYRKKSAGSRKRSTVTLLGVESPNIHSHIYTRIYPA